MLKNEIVFMVNRAFLDPRYQIIKPQYHVIVDNKLASGIWPITFLDQIAEMNPNVTFLLNSRWYRLPAFQVYKEKYKIFWLEQSLEFTQFAINQKLDLSTITYSKYVVEQAITSAIYMGLTNIYFLGVEGNGLAYTMTIKTPIHTVLMRT